MGPADAFVGRSRKNAHWYETPPFKNVLLTKLSYREREGHRWQHHTQKRCNDRKVLALRLKGRPYLYVDFYHQSEQLVMPCHAL